MCNHASWFMDMFGSYLSCNIKGTLWSGEVALSSMYEALSSILSTTEKKEKQKRSYFGKQ